MYIYMYIYMYMRICCGMVGYGRRSIHHIRIIYIYIVVMKGMFRCEKYGFGSNMMRWLKSCLWQVLNGVDMHWRSKCCIWSIDNTNGGSTRRWLAKYWFMMFMGYRPQTRLHWIAHSGSFTEAILPYFRVISGFC